MVGLAYVLAVSGYVFFLHLVVPGRWVDGYVSGPDGKKLRYRLNGLRVYLLTVATWAGLCASGLFPWEAFYLQRWPMLISACVLGLIFSAVIVFRAKPNRSNVLLDFYFGRLENPQALGGKLDAKMWLYLVGATQLGLNIYSWAFAHRMLFGADSNPGVLLYAGLFSFFLCEYLFFEEVHLYTFDFMVERVGFKLGWGCLTFYPFFYAVGLWNAVERGNPQNTVVQILAVPIFFLGWSFARGANLQKFHFKRDPTRTFLGIVPEALEGRVLVNGFWGLSRHVNYLGELLMATGLTLALGWPGVWQTWLYPLYYVALLIPRQLDDDARCARKYGPLWDTYVKRVRWRIIPFVY